MAQEDKPNTADSDPPPESRRIDTLDAAVPPKDGAEVSPSGGAPNAASEGDIGEAIADGRWAAPWSALEDVMQSLGRQEAAWRRTVASVMAFPVLPPATIALVQELQKPPVFPPGLAAPFQEAQSVLRGDDITRSIMRSQVASLAEIVGDLSRSAIATTWPRVSLLESEAARLIHMRDETLRRMTELVRSSSLEREVAAVSNVMRLPREIVESRMSQWLDAKSAVASLQELAAQVMSERPPWPGAYESGPSNLFASNVGGPESYSSSTPPEVEPSPIVMPARPSWRAHPGRRRSYTRAIERRDRKAAGVLPAGVSAEQWDLLVSIARERGCPIAQVVQELFDLLTGAPSSDRKRQVWALGGHAASREIRAPSGDAQRVLIRDRGGVFRVSFGGVSREFRKTKGFHILKYLTDNPRKQYWAGELWAAASGRGAGAVQEQAQGHKSPAAWVQEVGPASPCDVGAMELTDRKAVRAFKKRVKELDGLIAEANGRGDCAAIDALTNERALTLAETPFKEGGKGSRYEHSELEKRVRKNVGNLVRIALRSLERDFPVAEAEIRAHLRLGYRCTYGGPLS